MFCTVLLSLDKLTSRQKCPWWHHRWHYHVKDILMQSSGSLATLRTNITCDWFSIQVILRSIIVISLTMTGHRCMAMSRQQSHLMLLHCMGRRSTYGYMLTPTMVVASTLISHELDSVIKCIFDRLLSKYRHLDLSK